MKLKRAPMRIWTLPYQVEISLSSSIVRGIVVKAVGDAKAGPWMRHVLSSGHIMFRLPARIYQGANPAPSGAVGKSFSREIQRSVYKIYPISCSYHIARNASHNRH